MPGSDSLSNARCQEAPGSLLPKVAFVLCSAIHVRAFSAEPRIVMWAVLKGRKS